MRRAKVITHSLIVHKAPGDDTKIGYVHHGDTVQILSGPIERRLRWWEIRATPIGGKPLEGWVCDGAHGIRWLDVEPDDNEPLPDFRLPYEPPIEVGNISYWWAVVPLILAALFVLINWLF